MDEDTYRLEGLTVKEHLQLLARQGNKPFAESLHPGIQHVLGVRIPELRKLAARIARAGGQSYLASADTYYMEERMLQGMVLGYIKPDADVETYLKRVADFVRIINSWSVCDTFKFGGGRAFIKANRERLWQFLCGYLHATGEYEVRFGVVMLMEYFIDAEHVDPLLEAFVSVRHEGYYARMAVAWALSVCFVKFPAQTLACLQSATGLDDFTYNKTLQKITESYRVDAGMKAVIRSMKRR